MKTLKELINIDSYSDNENSEIINYLVQQFKQDAKEIIKIKNPNNEKENLIIGLNTKVENVEAIVLSGHIDTVNLSGNRPYKNVGVHRK